MSASEAPGGIIIAMGSPGTTRSSTKTMAPTPNKVGGTSTIRRMISPHRMAVVPRWFGPASSGRRDELRKDHAVRLRDDLQSLLVDDGLHILEQRDHLALLGDVPVDRLVAGDALVLVLLAPQGTDALDEVLALPGAMRRGTEHRKAGRGRGIADRIA